MGSIYEEVRLALHGIWTRRWIALAVAWGVCLIGWVAVSLIPNQYQSVARVVVEMRNILPAETAASGQAESARNLDRVRQTLTSVSNLEKVVRGTAINATVKSPGDLNARAAELQRVIKVTALQDNLFEISATVSDGALGVDNSARIAQAVVTKMIEIFVDENLSGRRNDTREALKFLDDQIADRQQRLQDAEERRSSFANQYLSTLPGTGTLTERVSAARSQIAQVESDLAGAQSSLNSVNAQLAGTGSTSAGAGGTAIAGPARARLAAIEGQIAEGRARGWTASHPDMVALANQLAAARAAAQNEPLNAGAAGGANPLFLQLKSMQTDRSARVAELTQQRDTLRGQIALLEAKLAADPQAASEQAQIDREIAAMKAQYDRLLDDREQIRLQSQVQNQTDATKFSVVDGPSLPATPTSPNRPLLLTGVLVLGMAAGVAAAFGMSRIQTTFPTAARLAAASGLPVIGSIGEVVSAAQTTLRRKRLRQFAGAISGLGFVFMTLLAAEILQRGPGA